MNRIRNWRSTMTFFNAQNLLLFEFIAVEFFIVFFNSHKELHLSSPMSWIKVVSACGDDVFDENADDMTVISNEWVSNMKKRVRVNAGFSVC